MREPQPLSAAISELIAKRGLAAPRGNAEVAAAWRRVAGERIAGDSRVLYLRDGTIHIGVASSALLNELVSFHSQRLLAELQTECSKIDFKHIRFQLKTNQ
jgi:predicted nucleic acid-binding Zn ribbon protein